MDNSVNVLPPFKVLIVDDDPDIAEVIGEFVREIYQDRVAVVLTFCGYDALDYVKNNRVDILITDLKMPKMEGSNLVYQTRQLNPGIHTLVCSGFLNLVAIASARAEGVLGVIEKPPNEKTIKKALGPVLEQLESWGDIMEPKFRRKKSSA